MILYIFIVNFYHKLSVDRYIIDMKNVKHIIDNLNDSSSHIQ